jgi:sigma-B regulation protein RsbU (phosphoserine phosphatase)
MKPVVAAYVVTAHGSASGFHVLATDDARLDLLVGDALGGDVAQVGVAAERHLMLMQAGWPGAILDALQVNLAPQLSSSGVALALALYRWDGAAGQLTYANAGHAPALLARAGGAIELLAGACSAADGPCIEITLPLAPGDALAVYSDRMTQLCNGDGEPFGAERVQALIASARQAGLPPAIASQMVHKCLADFAGSDVAADGYRMVIVEMQPVHMALLQDLPLSHDMSPVLRRFIEAHSGALAPEAADGLLLASVEATTNVIRHVASPLAGAGLSCRISGSARHMCVELFYLGKLFTPDDDLEPDFSGDADGGFGLFIISNAVESAEYLEPAAGVCCIRLVQQIAEPVPPP